MWRVRDRHTFDRLRRSSVRVRRGSVSVTRADAGPVATEPMVAFAIGRRVGPAVIRNRIRRQLRETVRSAALPPAAYLVRVAPGAAERASIELRRDLLDALAALPAGDAR